jgi:exopolysaccharide production protein ExoY
LRRTTHAKPPAVAGTVSVKVATLPLGLPPAASPSSPSAGTAASTKPLQIAAADRPLGGPTKRVVDVTLAVLLLFLSAPVILLMAAAIRLSMGGPVVFGHKRLGYGGRTFVCYKFRTMAANAQELLGKHLAECPEAAREWAATRKLSHDPRITALGHILRKSSLDELPQLFNVLIGDMSLIGPRPIVPDELAHYGRCARAYLAARPGITGVWQTNGRSSVSYRTRVACDRYYARRWSLALDLKLLLKTIPAVLKFDQTS